MSICRSSRYFKGPTSPQKSDAGSLLTCILASGGKNITCGRSIVTEDLERAVQFLVFWSVDKIKNQETRMIRLVQAGAAGKDILVLL